MIIITLQFTDETALTLATGKNRTEVVKVLLQDTGIDVNLKDQHGKYSITCHFVSNPACKLNLTILNITTKSSDKVPHTQHTRNA